LWPFNKKDASKPEPWLSRQEARRIRDYRAANPTAVIRSIFIKANGASSWLEIDYPDTRFFLSLKRSFEVFPNDWEEVTALALQFSGLSQDQCNRVLAAVSARAELGGCYILLINPEGYSFQDCVGDFRTVPVAEETF